MKTLYLIFVVLTDPNGYESMHKASDMQFSTKQECLAELQHYSSNNNNSNSYNSNSNNKANFFCGESDLYFNKEQVFY